MFSMGGRLTYKRLQEGCKMDVSGTESDQLPSIHKFVSSLSYAVFSS